MTYIRKNQINEIKQNRKSKKKKNSTKPKTVQFLLDELTAERKLSRDIHYLLESLVIYNYVYV